MLPSGRGEEQALRVEKVLMESGAIVRSAFFAKSFSEGNLVGSLPEFGPHHGGRAGRGVAVVTETFSTVLTVATPT